MKINFPSTFEIISSKLTISKKFSVFAFLETNDEPDKNIRRRSNLEARLEIFNRSSTTLKAALTAFIA